MPRAVASVLFLLTLAGVQLADASRGGDLVGLPVVVLGTALAGYLVGRTAGATTAAAAAAVAAVALTWAHQLASPGAYPVLDDLVFSSLVVGAPAAAGALVRGRRLQVRELERVAALLAAQRGTGLTAARLEERNRVEMRLHRGFSEQVAAMAMRAESVVDADDDAVRRALHEVEVASRQSLDELRGALGSLRDRPSATPSQQRSSDEPRPAVTGRPVTAADLALALGCASAMAVESVVSPQAHGPAVLDVTVALLAGGVLVVRRSRPFLATGLTFLGLAVMSAWLTPATAMVTTIFTVLVCGFTVGAQLSGLRRILGAVWVLLGLAIVAALPDGLPAAEDAVPMVVFVTLAVAGGAAASGWAGRAAELRAAVAELQDAREVEVGLAVAEERHRLAGELHDTVAHALTVICLQAGAGQLNPDAATVSAVLDAARGALSELREGLDIADGSHDLGAAALVAMARRAGLRPQVRVTGRIDHLPPASRNLALRVVREAVTNAGRYAPGAQVSIEVDAREALRVAVVDEGGTAGAPAEGWGTGSGLRGLATALDREGGTLAWGPTSHGFRVEATLPRAGVTV